MNDVLSRLDSHDIAGMISVFLTFLAGMIVWVTLQWRLHRRTEMEVALKQAMLNRGMSADEIEQVMQASFSSRPDKAKEPASRASR